MSKHFISIECTCEETFIQLTGQLAHDETMIVTHDCGQQIHIASIIDYSAELTDIYSPARKLAYAIVDDNDVPDLLINIHGGEVTCRDHAGSQLSAALSAKPRAKKWSTSFGDYVRATAADVAAWRMEDLAIDCETCASQKRRAA
jgi:hypothetical protein